MQQASNPISSTYNVRDFGASGNKNENSQASLQLAIDACAEAGGGMVYFPPGAYTSGTLFLRSNVRLHLEAGAVLYSSKNPDDFPKRGLLYAEDIENITLEGRGTVDGQAQYEWRLTDMRDWYIYPNELAASAAGLPLMRSFPTANSIGNLVLFIRCKNVKITSLTFLHSPSWTMHLWGCEHLVIDGVDIRTSLRDGVWADGIDPDGCKDVHISNCTIETGDDALVFYSSSIFGPARPCENITVSNCRLTSASSALKFCDGNMNAIRNVTIQNCVITDSNRGIAFMVFDGGVLENVVISNVTIECKRYDWFWWGDGDPIHFNLIQRSEIDANIDKSKESPPGIMRNIILKNVFARGQGSCLIHGHVDLPIENVTLEDVRIELENNPDSAPRKFERALQLENACNVKFQDVEVEWVKPISPTWKHTLGVGNVSELVFDSVAASPCSNSADGTIVFTNVSGARIESCSAKPGTDTYLELRGAGTKNIRLIDNDFSQANEGIKIRDDVSKEEIIS